MQTTKTQSGMTAFHLGVPGELLKQIDEFFGQRKRAQFTREAMQEKMKKLRLLKALDAAAGCWKAKDHPELRHGSVAYVRKLRKEWDTRFRKQFSR